MKKMCFLLLILGWLGVNGQNLVYGPLNITGFEKITHGAMWSERPWAKTIFGGGEIPSGMTVDTLMEEHFVMFVQGENNPLDKNYIIFPIGEIIINKGGEKFAARCGNKILSIRPVSHYTKMFEGQVDGKIILRDTIKVEVHVSFDELIVRHKMDTMVIVHLIKNQIEQPLQVPAENIFTPDKQKTWLGKNWPYVVGGAVLAAGGAGFIFHGDGIWYGLGGSKMVIEPRTMPPGLDSNTSNGGLDSDSRGMGGGISSIGFGASFSF